MSRNLHVGVNDLLNDNSQNSMDNWRRNFEVIIQNCRAYDAGEVFSSSIVYNTKAKLALLKKMFVMLKSLYQ